MLDVLKSEHTKEIEEKAYEEAAEELRTGSFNKGLKAKAFSKADGNEEKAKAIYIRLRSKQIIKKYKQQENEPSFSLLGNKFTFEKLNNFEKLLIAIVLIVLLILALDNI